MASQGSKFGGIGPAAFLLNLFCNKTALRCAFSFLLQCCRTNRCMMTHKASTLQINTDRCRTSCTEQHGRHHFQVEELKKQLGKASYRLN